MKLLIIGVGQLGHVAREIALDCGYSDIKFLDDCSTRDDVIGTISDIEKVSNEYTNVIVAIGNNEKRCSVINSIPSSMNLVTLIHPKAYVSGSARIEKGCIVMPLAAINTNVIIEYGCIIGLNAVIDHNASLGICTHIDCGANVRPSTCVDMFTKVCANDVFEKK